MNRSRWKVLGIAALLSAFAGSEMLLAAEGGTSADRPARRGRTGTAVQPGSDKQGTGLRRPDQLAEQLHLTQDQRQKIRALWREQRDKIEALRNDTSLTPQQRREKARALAEEHQQKMKEILTPEQYEKWQQRRESRGPGAGAGARANRPGPPPGGSRADGPTAR